MKKHRLILWALILSAVPVWADDSALLVRLEADAREAPRQLLHARLVIPAASGALTLYYPKWIPGEHSPTGPITDLAGLKISAADKPLAWRRDPIDMFAFHVDVPGGDNEITVTLDFLLAGSTEGFSSAASATPHLAVINWNQVLLYPAGVVSSALTYEASLRLPEGWKYGTALATASKEQGTVTFLPVSLTKLVDSPVIAGKYFRTIDLSPGGPRLHQIHVAADSAAALEMKPETVGAYSRLVAETGVLFGARHYDSYHFLLALSDHVAHFGLEHHESSDDRTAERMLIDDDLRKSEAGLLPHEMVHSWNGKYRRPAGMCTPDYQEPEKTELLWVYEGLTSYLGDVLTTRCGLWTPSLYRQSLALEAAALNHRSGRTWRPLQDTTVAAQLLYPARPEWQNWRRGVDFYPEGVLIWLEADVIIRQQTEGRRSLDDFCRRFTGGQSGPPSLHPYRFEELLADLNATASYDWRRFFEQRLRSTQAHAPLGGLEGSGWRLVYKETPTDMFRIAESEAKLTDLSYSLGLQIKEDGSIFDVVVGEAAEKAGLGPGMKVVAINGRRWSSTLLHEAIKDAATTDAPLELLMENAEFYKTYKLSYHGGERYPTLERDESRPDLLERILHPLVSTASETH